jgi:SAM-dependent methyltransferase
LTGEGGVESEVVVGNVFDKYGTRNPVYRWLVDGYFRQLDRFLRRAPARRILEVGCGEGYVAHWVDRILQPEVVVGLDLSPVTLAEARDRHPGVAFVEGTAYRLPFADQSFDLVMCLEILEHLENPRKALQEARRAGKGHLIASVPREPIWRLLNVARGAYWGRLGNTPGHRQHWSHAKFIDLLKKDWIVRNVAAPLPWTMALCSIH